MSPALSDVRFILSSRIFVRKVKAISRSYGLYKEFLGEKDTEYADIELLKQIYHFKRGNPSFMAFTYYDISFDDLLNK